MALAVNTPSTPSPAPHTPPASVALIVLKWVRRLLALVFAIFLGMFFVEHIGEWYTNPHAAPPLWVGVTMLGHLAMIVGLLAMLRWERVGSALTVLGTLVFLGTIAIVRSTLHLPYILLYCLIPVGIVLIEIIIAKTSATRSHH